MQSGSTQPPHAEDRPERLLYKRGATTTAPRAHAKRGRAAWFLAGRAKRLGWAAVAEAFHAPRVHVFRAAPMAVRWGLGGPQIPSLFSVLNRW